MKNLKPSQGNVLIEALIATVIVGISGLALAKLQANNNLQAGDAEQRLQATQIAAKLNEEALTSSNSSSDGFTTLTTTQGSSGGNATTYTTSRTITAVQDTNYKNVKSTVSWTDRQNQGQSVSLSSGVAKPDVSLSGTLAKLTSLTSNVPLIVPTITTPVISVVTSTTGNGNGNGGSNK